MYIPNHNIYEALENGKSLLKHLIDSKMKKEALYILKNIETIYDKKNHPFLRSLLFKCIFNNMEEVALELLKKCVNPEFGECFLMYAIDNNMESLVLELLKRENINPNIKDDRKKTILIQALESNMKKVAKELLKNKDLNYNEKDKDGNTALILACKNKI